MNLAFYMEGDVNNINPLDLSKDIEEKLDCIFKSYIKSGFGNYYLFNKTPSIQRIYEKYIEKKNKKRRCK